MAKNTKKTLSPEESQELLKTLQVRFEKNMDRHKDIKWDKVQEKLKANSGKMWSLNEMEKTGGEPDVVSISNQKGDIVFCDCSPESPKGRRSICYDPEALASRKEHKPKNSALGMASEMGIEILTEEQYRYLQQFGPFDTKTSTWVKTSNDIRERGGAIFCDYRYGHVFMYHNGAESYYASRGFRGMLKV